MKPVSDLLKGRVTAIKSVPPSATVFEAIKVMAENNVGALMVMEGDKLVGILSERDYARKIALESRNSKDTPVRDIMTNKVYTVSPTARTKDCMAVMKERGFRHLPIVDNGKVVGMLSMRDIMNDIITEHELTISQLEAYIHQ
jgi:CBS domain-containing protein